MNQRSPRQPRRRPRKGERFRNPHSLVQASRDLDVIGELLKEAERTDEQLIELASGNKEHLAYLRAGRDVATRELLDRGIEALMSGDPIADWRLRFYLAERLEELRHNISRRPGRKGDSTEHLRIAIWIEERRREINPETGRNYSEREACRIVGKKVHKSTSTVNNIYQRYRRIAREIIDPQE